MSVASEESNVQIVSLSEIFPFLCSPKNPPSLDGPNLSQWHLRYTQAAERYGKMNASPELMDSLADGFMEWASLLPQTEVDRGGRHKQVNSWGLGAELESLRWIEIVLEMDGQIRLADRLSGMARDLHQAARRLDECYPKQTEDDEAAERRLTLTCQAAAKTLAQTLRRLKKSLFGIPPTSARPSVPATIPDTRGVQANANSPNPPRRKRAPRAANIEMMRRELVKHIKDAYDHARTAISLNREPALLPRPSKTELGRRVGLKLHAVTRCFQDSAAHELRLLWETADDLDAVLKYHR